MCYIYNVNLFVAKRQTLRKVDYKLLENSETWGCRKMEKNIWYNRVRNKVCIIAERQGGGEYIVYNKETKTNWTGSAICRN